MNYFFETKLSNIGYFFSKSASCLLNWCLLIGPRSVETNNIRLLDRLYPGKSVKSMPNKTTFSNHYYLLSFFCVVVLKQSESGKYDKYSFYFTPGRNLPFLESPVIIFLSIVHTICTGASQAD